MVFRYLNVYRLTKNAQLVFKIVEKNQLLQDWR